MDTKKNDKISAPKKTKPKIKNINNNICLKKKIKINDINNKNTNYKNNPNININKVYLRVRDSSKNNKINKNINSTTYKIRKTKHLSNNNVFTNFNKARQENNLFEINNRFSCHIQNKVINNNNSKLRNRLTMKRTSRKNLKEINLTINDITDNYKKLSKNKTNHILSKHNESKKENTKEKIEILRRTYILKNKKKIYENLNLYKGTNEKEKKDENEIKNKVARHDTSLFILENGILFSDEKIENKKNKNNSKVPICQINTGEHELDKFFRYNSNINNPNNELIRFSNISNINKNEDVYYLNKNMTEVRNNYNNNNKIETIEVNESQEILDFEEKILEEINDNQNNLEKNDENKLEQIITVPCLICNKLINIDEADEHSNKCFNTKKNNNIKDKDNSDNYLIIIHNKLKNILEYLEKIQKSDIYIFDNINPDYKTNSEYIKELKLNINKILNINEIKKSSLDELSKINNKINTLMEQCLNSQNIFTLFSRTKILLEEKSKFFSDKIKKNWGGIYASKKNLENNTFEEILSENETAEFFDLKKMEKILDEKELKTENLEKLINETKNKRLFLIEVLKVKFQKINENKNEDLIQPEMIWKEAVKKNIEMKNWTQFIFNELNNPNKYLKMLNKKNN